MSAASKSTAPQDKTPPFESLSEAVKTALRAQAYPGILDDRGREWKLGMIADQAAKIEAQEATIAGLVEALIVAKVVILDLHEHGRFDNGVTDSTGTIDEGDVLTGHYVERTARLIIAALASARSSIQKE